MKEHLWSNCLAARRYGGICHTHLQKNSGGKKGAVSFAEVEEDILEASFAVEEDKMRALNNGPWMHLGSPVLLAKWEADKLPEELLIEKIQLVVQIHDLSWEMRCEGTARRCAAMAGEVLECVKPNQNLSQYL